MRWLFLCAVACMAAAGRAYSQNTECWGGGAGEQWGPRITCTQLTEQLLMRLQGAERSEVPEVMSAPGRPTAPGWLHYESHYNQRRGAGAGMMNLHFNADGRVDIIEADVDRAGWAPDIQYVWNAHVGGCSDFPDSQRRCN